ncbi:uncharacterized protein LOC134172357 isoform X2 [Pezoporus occidentalis]|uniref:uncharacterized protein LOC134172357 isoform X2 n=1 Tax=Pezoporus occidentalis TaxID=407982 RepID=UPI002F906A1C
MREAHMGMIARAKWECQFSTWNSKTSVHHLRMNTQKLGNNSFSLPFPSVFLPLGQRDARIGTCPPPPCSYTCASIAMMMVMDQLGFVLSQVTCLQGLRPARGGLVSGRVWPETSVCVILALGILMGILPFLLTLQRSSQQSSRNTKPKHEGASRSTGRKRRQWVSAGREEKDAMGE